MLLRTPDGPCDLRQVLPPWRASEGCSEGRQHIPGYIMCWLAAELLEPKATRVGSQGQRWQLAGPRSGWVCASKTLCVHSYVYMHVCVHMCIVTHMYTCVASCRCGWRSPRVGPDPSVWAQEEL